MSTSEQDGIAVIGMAGRFPAADSVAELWANLLAGERAIRRFEEAELAAAGVPESLRRNPSYRPFGADLAGIDLFDADFFGIPAHEARLIDPQHRIFLETCWRALEDAGHDPGGFGGRIGVFGATGLSTYLLNVVAGQAELPEDGLSYPVLLGNDKDYLCTRAAYRLGLTGPAVTVQTACSSSLVAVHLAVESLLAFECDLALVGGVSVAVPQHTGYLHREGGIFSPDGQCRVFDAEAAGTVRGSGCGVVVLRRLADAVTGQDRVDAVIRGSAVNNDGRDKAGFTAPSAAGQTEVIRDALAVSGVPAEQIGYVEAHGTGTALGDPIEVRALTEALGTDPGRYLGSVKANLGHLDVAAGVTGLIKTVLVLREQRIPAQVGYTAPNAHIADQLAAYRIPTSSVRPEQPLRAAAVSSFGLGGTNAHVVLTAAAEPDRPAPPGGSYRVQLSARDRTALAVQIRDLHEHLARHEVRLDDLAFTLANGRAPFAAQAAWRVRSVAELRQALADHLAGQGDPATAATGDPDDFSVARRIPLPGHPLRGQRHWIDAAPAPTAAAGLAEQVRQRTATFLRTPELAPGDDLYEIGLDSMAAVELVTLLREDTGLPLTFESFDGLRTVEEVVAHLSELAAGAADTGHRHLLTELRPGTAPGHVFLVPPAGGSTTSYLDLSKHLGEERTLWALGHPVERAAEFATIRGLAALYTGLVREVQPQGPYTIVGYSFGGSVAFEMATELERAGERVDRLIMLDSHPPEAYLGGDTEDRDFLAAFGALLTELFPGTVLPATSASTVEEVLACCDDGTWSPAVRAELAKFFRIWRDNHRALKRWYPDHRLAADITQIRAEARENAEIMSTLDMGTVDKGLWAKHTEGRLHLLPTPGDHYSMIRNPDHAAVLGKVLDGALRDTPGAR
ncbi:beta-ketoacyl synthase N-terminal-like domain-containing protein [Crossiella sp. CA-258035]|uniref:beta-ketoacyl synthase N-terminal-like domain-containing protein n=1 Tax=Crossiella sp. CA-258035 TaxID=2981138 RepID=UPI0024BC1423|nr:beta-ketoacyl synthase N-terminal-like domain-containing protein [Crossiella sp. CA-258035]WHT17581.1 beta-ketoacyl synthase N-terminal-like domain-containing protein [Crossiella sp. CA-258035]